MLGVRLPAAVRADVLPALAAVNCYAALRGDSVRIAPHLHVTDTDIACLMDGLALSSTAGAAAVRSSWAATSRASGRSVEPGRDQAGMRVHIVTTERR